MIRMFKTVFLFLCFVPFLCPQAYGSVEIYAKGHQYDSLQTYLTSKKLALFRAHQKGLSDETRHKLYVLSIENGITGVLQDFYQAWDQSRLQTVFRISPDQLQNAIQQAVTASKDPKLLISQPGKVRIMELTSSPTKN
jgi:hypothetical protein